MTFSSVLSYPINTSNSVGLSFLFCWIPTLQGVAWLISKTDTVIQQQLAIPNALIGVVPAFSMEANVGELFPHVALFPSISYWRSGETDLFEGISFLEGTRINYSEFNLSVDARYDLPTGDSLSWFFGAGAGFSSAKASVATGSVAGTVEGDGNGLALSLIGGVNRAIGDKTFGILEARYQLEGGFTPFFVNIGLSRTFGGE